MKFLRFTPDSSVVLPSTTGRKMLETNEPLFLTREMVDEIHEAAISEYGGLRGVPNEHLLELESAVNQPRHTHHLGGGDLFDAAAAYAFHIVADHPYWDGNKRTGIGSALIFLRMNSIDTTCLPELATYECLIKVADHKMDRKELAAFLRQRLES